MKKYKAVYIKWEDAMHPESCGWLDENDSFFTEKGFIVETVGWLVDESKSHYMVSMAFNKEKDGYLGKVLHLERIPKSCVVKKKFIKL